MITYKNGSNLCYPCTTHYLFWEKEGTSATLETAMLRYVTKPLLPFQKVFGKEKTTPDFYFKNFQIRGPLLHFQKIIGLEDTTPGAFFKVFRVRKEERHTTLVVHITISKISYIFMRQTGHKSRVPISATNVATSAT